jgi:hypothetical protein
MVETTAAVIVVKRHYRRLDRDAVSLADTGHVLADFDDFGREFVTEDLRQRSPGELMLVNRSDDGPGCVFMQVSAADAAPSV